MIDQIFTFESTRVKQRTAPMLQEREAFLRHLYERQTSQACMRSIASTLLQIIRLMDMTSFRIVSQAEIKDAASRWREDDYPIRGRYPKSLETFTSVATRWFQFAGALGDTPTVKTENAMLLEDFQRHLSAEKGYADFTIRTCVDRLHAFQLWAENRELKLKHLTLADVDLYLDQCCQRGLKPSSMNGVYFALRAFFRYLAECGQDTSSIVRGIRLHRASRYSVRIRGPQWVDVRRLLDEGFGSSPIEVRTSAVVTLAAIYALRRCEISRLKLSDIDWIAETITIRRGKNGKVQQFPVQFEVGEKILAYLRVRGKSSLKNLFLSIRPPYRPLDCCAT